MEIELEISDLKLATTTYLGTPPEIRSWDIVDMNRGIVLGIFRRDSERWSLEFIGDRPFRYRDWDFFMKFAEISQRLLDITNEVDNMVMEYE
jgi:hypothetical protein